VDHVDHAWTRVDQGDGMEGVRLSAGSVREWHGGYQARFNVAYTDADGTDIRRQVTKSVEARTLAAARRALPDVREEVKSDLERRLLVDRAYPGDSDGLLPYMTRYVDEREASHAIAATTAANYRSSAKHIMRHLRPDVRLGEVDAAMVRRMDARLLADGLAEDTVSKSHRFLKQVLDAAEEEGLIARNPITRAVRPPKRQRREPDALDDEAARRLEEIVGDMELTPLTLAIRLAMETAMRNEECLGLKWQDLELRGDDGDVIRGTIHVRRAVTTAGGRVIAKGPKSAAGYRDIPITANLAEALRSWAHKAFGTEPGDPSICELYVLGTDDGRPFQPTRLTRAFSQLAGLYGIRCASGKLATFYALRHTAITRMLRAGVDAKTVASIAGHSKVALTLDIYASTDASAKAKAVELTAITLRHEAENRSTR